MAVDCGDDMDTQTIWISIRTVNIVAVKQKTSYDARTLRIRCKLTGWGVPSSWAHKET